MLGVSLLLGCGGDGATSDDDAQAKTPALSAAGDGELTAYVQRKLRQRLVLRTGAPQASLDGSFTTIAPVTGTATATTPGSRATNQEGGVDEPDLLAFDGTHAYTLDANDPAQPQLRVYGLDAGGGLAELGRHAVGASQAGVHDARGLLLNDDGAALAVLSQRYSLQDSPDPCIDACPAFAIVGPVWQAASVAVHRFDTRDPAQARAGVELVLDGQLLDARRVGDRLVVVTLHVPTLAAERLPTGATPDQIEAAIAATRAADVLPRLRVNGGAAAPLLAEADCWLQPGNGSPALEITTITTLDLRAETLAPKSRCFVGGSEAMYMTTGSLYLASTRTTYLPGPLVIYPEAIRTDLHKFAFDGGDLVYRGSGSVAGHLGWDPQRKSLRLSEHEGALRVLTFTAGSGWATTADARVGAVPPSPVTLSVLREAVPAASLETVATLPNARRPQAIGKPGEQLHGVRFAGTRGYAVTFRQIDPLVVLDLSDPTDPKIAGELEAPGFSDHLLPLAPHLLLGVGRHVDDDGRLGGVKVAVFDVGDAARPRTQSELVFGGAGSVSALDFSRHGIGIAFDAGRARAALPLAWTGGAAPMRNGVQGLEIDLASGALAARTPLAVSEDTSAMDIGRQRALPVGEQVLYLRGGELSVHAW